VNKIWRKESYDVKTGRRFFTDRSENKKNRLNLMALLIIFLIFLQKNILYGN